MKFSQQGRGAFQAFFPAYVLGKTNSVSPLSRCENIEKMCFKGKCIDKFCYPKRVVRHNDFYKEKTVKLEIDYKELVGKKLTIDKDIFNYKINWLMLYSYDVNNALNVEAELEIEFKNPKNINEIISYYHNLEKFFASLVNRRIIEFQV